jgi:hypothetical protein
LIDLTGKLPAGSYVLYVQAVSQPSIRNHGALRDRGQKARPGSGNQ